LRSRIVTLRKQGLDAQAILAEERENGGEEMRRPPDNVWLSPFKLLTALAIEPVRSRFTDSVGMFVRQRLVRLTRSGDERFVYLATFMQKSHAPSRPHPRTSPAHARWSHIAAHACTSTCMHDGWPITRIARAHCMRSSPTLSLCELRLTSSPSAQV
jgi:hypothetical protein